MIAENVSSRDPSFRCALGMQCLTKGGSESCVIVLMDDMICAMPFSRPSPFRPLRCTFLCFMSVSSMFLEKQIASLTQLIDDCRSFCTIPVHFR